MAATCALSAEPDPVTAALTSLGVWNVTGTPLRAAVNAATPEAWAVSITEFRLCCAKTRSMPTASGWYSSSHSLMPRSRLTSLAATSSMTGVRTTPTAIIVGGRPTLPSTTPIPQRVRPGSIPMTRIPARQSSSSSAPATSGVRSTLV